MRVEKPRGPPQRDHLQLFLHLQFIPAGINCLVEWDVVGSAKGTLGVNWKGTWSGCVVNVWGVKGKGSGV